MNGIRNKAAFITYYVRFRVRVISGRHMTHRPKSIAWRWRQWKKGYRG